MNKEQSNLISAFHSKYAYSMTQLTYRRTCDEELSQDLVQETFLIACRKSNIICKHENPAGWLFSTLKNLTMREMKKSFHSDVLFNGEFTIESDGFEFSMDQYIPASLSNSERELILLRVDECLSYEEISNIKGVSEAACRKQVSRTFTKCRELLSKDKSSLK